MTQRKTPSLLYAEYLSPDPDSSGQVWKARLQLFETVRRVYPKFLGKLLAEVFPLYARLAQDGYDFNVLWRSRSPYEALPRDSGLRSALSLWAVEFNAAVGWLMDDAIRTFRLWHVASDQRAALSWNTLHGHRLVVGMGDTFTFVCEGWETTLLPWPAYRDAVRRRFEEKLSDYEKETRALAKSQGLVRAQRKYSLKNLEWFVLYQFAGKSSKAIADRYETDDSTVLKGIKAAAKLLGWERLRDSAPRRNRKIR